MARALYRFGIVILLALGLCPSPAAAQSQTTLPADLFVLNEQGQVLRIAASGGFAATVTPPDQQVIDFGIAPDGQWIAYRSAPETPAGVFLAVVSVDGLSGQLMEFETAGQPPITGRGQTLAWSPDAAAIAYTTATGVRFYLAGLGEFGAPLFVDMAGGPFLNLAWSPGGSYLAAEAENDTWLIYRRQGDGVVEAGRVPASAGLAWVREGVLALAPPAGGLIALSLVDGSQQVLLGAEVLVSQPTLLSGGRLIFRVHDSSGQTFAARRFGTVSLQGGDYQEIPAATEITAAMRWLPDGAALLATLDGALTLIEPRTDARRELMVGVKAYAWGPLPPSEVVGVTLPTDLYFLANDAAGVTQVWRLPADGSPAMQVTAAADGVIDFGLSPDHTQIAYTTGRRLVAANLDGSNQRELSPVAERPGAGAQPAWSPDGRLIAFVRDGIWIVPSMGGPRTELLTDSLDENTPPDQVRVYGVPQWSPDGALLLVMVGYYEGAGLAILPITGGPAVELPIGSMDGAWLPNGQILTWASGGGYVTPGLYLVNPADLSLTTILNDAWSVLDAVPLANEVAMILRDASGGAMGPGGAQPFLVPILPEALAIPHGQGGLIESPVLSPEGTFAAGLRQMHYGDYGAMGRLAIIRLETGEQFAVQTPGEVWGLQWGVRS